MRENDFFTFSFPFTVKFAPQLLDQRYVSAKLEVFIAFLFHGCLVTDGRTDGRGATLNAASLGGSRNKMGLSAV